MGLYHRQTSKWLEHFDKESLELIKSANELSKHLWQHIDEHKCDKKHCIDLQKLYIIINELKSYENVEPFEVETEKGEVTKCVVRTKYNDTQDIIIVFRKGIVVTAYLNDSNDKHLTLNSKNYGK